VEKSNDLSAQINDLHTQRSSEVIIQPTPQMSSWFFKGGHKY